MAKPRPKQSSLLPAWLRHRSLVVTEAMLLVGLGQLFFNDWLLAHPDISPALRVVLGMAMVLGGFGGVLVWARHYLARTIADTHSIVRAIPLPTPKWVFHAGALGALYVGYSIYWSAKVGGLGQVLPNGLVE